MDQDGSGQAEGEGQVTSQEEPPVNYPEDVRAEQCQ